MASIEWLLLYNYSSLVLADGVGDSRVVRRKLARGFMITRTRASRGQEKF
jgi:hypothetical protein